MDFNKLIARVKNILLTPKTEWPVIAGEQETVQSLYTNYILILAAIPAIFGLRAGVTFAVVSYVITLAFTFVMALIIDALAPTFGGQKNQVQALKAAAYSSTAGWVAGVAAILPLLGGLIAIAAAIYGIYLLYLGLPQTMKSPQEKAVGYTAVSIIAAIVLYCLCALLLGLVIGASMLGGAALSGGLNSSTYTTDKDSPLGALAAMGQRAEAASKKLEAAQKSGDAKAQADAAGQMLGAVLGGGAQVEALAPDALKPFVPETLAGLPRTSFSVQKQSPMGMQVSVAEARYGDNSDNGPSYELTVTDSGSIKGLMQLAGFGGVEKEEQSDHGYEKTYHQNGRLMHEEWDNSGDGEYTVILGDRFVVMVRGSHVPNAEALKAAIGGLNLAGLEALKTHGVKNG